MKTGWPPGLLQDDCRKLFRWFADRIDARWVLRQTLKGKRMNITIYTKANCPNCTIAKAILISKGLEYKELDAQGNILDTLLHKYPDARQMPQIFIDGQRVGGLAGLQAALKQLGI
jgi:glutaredoxin 3